VIIHDRIHTIADGIGVRVPVPEALEDMHSLVDEAILVGEDTIIVKAMRLLHCLLLNSRAFRRGRGCGNPEQPELFDEKCVGTMICGGNLTMEQMQTWLY
jgi:threonine dehydratase